jgi:hypothetical protein
MPVSKGPDSINFDYRVTTLLLAMASREDLLKTYTATSNDDVSDAVRWKRLLDLGFPIEILQENLYIFNDPETNAALKKVQRAAQTMANLSDYCPDQCTPDFALTILIQNSAGIKQPLGDPGARTT